MTGHRTPQLAEPHSNGDRGDQGIRVLAVLDGYRVTGPARQLLSTAACLRSSGTQTMLALFSRKSASSPLLREADRSHLSVIRLPDRFPGDPRSIGVLTAVADDADLIQTHGYKANVLMRLVARRINKPWLAFLHGDTWENWKVRAYFALERRAVRRADRVATVSQAMATRIARSGVPSERVCVIPNASVIEPPPLAPQAWHRGTLPLVGVIGRLSPEKGVDLAIRAHVLLLRRRPDARLLIAGEGPEGATLRRLAERLGVAESLDWLGHREDVAALYPQLNVLLIPSRSEGMPNVALEAMSHGLPIVATTVGGVPELIHHGRTGMLVPSGDVAAMSRTVGDLLDDPDQRRSLGQEAQREVRERFSVRSRGSALARVYRELIGRPPADRVAFAPSHGHPLG